VSGAKLASWLQVANFSRRARSFGTPQACQTPRPPRRRPTPPLQLQHEDRASRGMGPWSRASSAARRSHCGSRQVTRASGLQGTTPTPWSSHCGIISPGALPKGAGRAAAASAQPRPPTEAFAPTSPDPCSASSFRRRPLSHTVGVRGQSGPQTGHPRNAEAEANPRYECAQ
jgi:hypothetical protein